MYIFWALLIVKGLETSATKFCRDSQTPGAVPVRYNESIELCCGGKLSPRLDENNQELACCEHQTNTAIAEKYLANRDVCCNGMVYKGKFGTNLSCCGNTQQYYTNQQRCCGNQLYSTGTDLDCCGSQRYNMSELGCCESEDDYKFTRVHQPDDLCCGTTLYNINQFDCNVDDNSLVELEQCGGYPYDTQQYVCCHGNDLVEKPREADGDIDVCNVKEVARDLKAAPGLTPCGAGFINTNSGMQEFCCDGVPHSVPRSHPTKILICCGTHLINESQKCCQNQVLTHSQTCCNGKVYSMKELHDNNQQCCQGKIIDKNSHMCCRVQSSMSRVVQKTNYADNRCCRFRYKDGEYYGEKIETFNSIIQRCSYKGGIKSPRLITRRRKCPHCGNQKRLAIVASCSRTKKYKLRIDNSTMNGTGMHLEVTILRPRSLAGKAISFWLKVQCRCIKAGQRKVLYTNKELRYRTVLLLKKRDQLLPNSKKVRMERKAVCGLSIQDNIKKLKRRNRKNSRSNRVRS